MTFDKIRHPDPILYACVRVAPKQADVTHLLIGPKTRLGDLESLFAVLSKGFALAKLPHTASFATCIDDPFFEATVL